MSNRIFGYAVSTCVVVKKPGRWVENDGSGLEIYLPDDLGNVWHQVLPSIPTNDEASLHASGVDSHHLAEDFAGRRPTRQSHQVVLVEIPLGQLVERLCGEKEVATPPTIDPVPITDAIDGDEPSPLVVADLMGDVELARSVAVAYSKTNAASESFGKI